MFSDRKITRKRSFNGRANIDNYSKSNLTLFFVEKQVFCSISCNSSLIPIYFWGANRLWKYQQLCYFYDLKKSLLLLSNSQYSANFTILSSFLTRKYSHRKLVASSIFAKCIFGPDLLNVWNSVIFQRIFWRSKNCFDFRKSSALFAPIFAVSDFLRICRSSVSL